MTTSYEHATLMDGVYRRQRHFYDLSRKYYLLGRDPMLAGLKPPAESTVLEIGCGTGRNLIKAATLYPDCRFFGIDISRAMLETAGRNVANYGLKGTIRLAHADAVEFDPARTFGHRNFDRIFISYAVSMIPQWRSVIETAARRMAPGGELHIVDFGDCAGLPAWSRRALNAWLQRFHVTPRADLFVSAASVAREYGFSTETHRLHRGFAWISVLRAPELTADGGFARTAA